MTATWRHPPSTVRERRPGHGAPALRVIRGSRSIVVPPVRDWLRPQIVMAAGGMRMGALPDTKLLCSVGAYELDVLVSEFASPQRLELLGQITRAGPQDGPANDIEVLLVRESATEPIARTRTDEFGEFVLRAGTDGPFALRIGDEANATWVLVWEDE